MPIEGEPKFTLLLLLSESNGESFSLVGELEDSVALGVFMISDVGSALRGLGLLELPSTGDSRLVPSAVDGRTPARFAVGGGVFAGDDFCGEIDLARSGRKVCQCQILRTEKFWLGAPNLPRWPKVPSLL